MLSPRLMATLLLTFLTAGCLRHRVECKIHGGAEWREYRTQHFVVWSDVEPEVAREQALDLEALRLGVRWYFGLPPEAEDLTPVVLLDVPDEMREFHQDVAGMMIVEGQPENSYFLAVRAAPQQWNMAHTTLTHELTHRFSREAIPRQASWLEEGIAEYVSSLTLNGPYEARFGDMVNRRIIDEAPLTLEELWAQPPFNELRGAAGHRAYASAWLYVHYLTNHQEARWKAFLEKLRQGADPKATFDAQFPASMRAELDEGARAYQRKARFTYSQLAFKYERTLLHDAELAPWQVHQLRVRLLKRSTLHSAELFAKAVDQEVTTLQALAPERIPFEVAVAKLDESSARAVVAKDYPDDYQARVTLAFQALRSHDSAAAETHARAALALNPKGPSAFEALGRAQLSQGKLDEAREQLKRATQLAPESFGVRQALGALAALSGQCEQVGRHFDRLLLLDGLPQNVTVELKAERDRLHGECIKRRSQR